MNKPYALASDIHCHNWSQFSAIDADGVNSRLRATLNELLRAATTIKGMTDEPVLRIAGDLFHVRGKIEPSVFNPTFECFKQIAEMGVDVQIIPGNHDLEGVTADTLGNAMQQLDLIEGVEVFIEPTVCDDGAVMVPWIESLEELGAECRKLAAKDRDLIIHAPLNGIITGLPDLGLDPVAVAMWGYKRVFVGHYHNFREPTPTVYSIGATTHQNWCDPGSLAGFCIVHDDKVEHYPTEAPLFINIDDVSDIDDRVAGNFVRLRLQDIEEDALKEALDLTKKLKAAGVVNHSVKKRTAVRGITAPQNVTLDVSVAQFVAKDLEVDDKVFSRKRIANDALDVLREARTVGGE